MIKPRPADNAAAAVGTLLDNLERMKAELVVSMGIAAACGALLGVIVGGVLVWMVLG